MEDETYLDENDDDVSITISPATNILGVQKIKKKDVYLELLLQGKNQKEEVKEEVKEKKPVKKHKKKTSTKKCKKKIADTKSSDTKSSDTKSSKVDWRVRNRIQENKKRREAALSVRNIGVIPDVVNLKRREDCVNDLAKFIVSYFHNLLPFSKIHKKVIKKISIKIRTAS